MALLAASAPFVRAQAAEQTFQFDCDVPPGKFSDWSGTVAPGLTGISGRIELLEPRSHKRWIPTAGVWLARGDERVGLQLSVIAATPDVVQVYVYRSRENGERTLLTTVPWRAHPIAFTLSYETSGDLKLTVEGKEAPLGMTGFHPEKLSLSCSTAQFKFIDVVVTSAADK